MQRKRLGCRWISVMMMMLAASVAFAQPRVGFVGCKDSMYATTHCSCGAPPIYHPVCGCDKTTYKNECFAINCGAVTSYLDGPCEEMDYYIFPTIVSQGTDINLQMAVKLPPNNTGASTSTTSAQIIIFDMFGKRYFYRFINSIDPQYPLPIYISTDAYPTGLYFMLVIMPDGFYKMKRFEVQVI